MVAPLRVALVGYGLAGKAFHAPLISSTKGLRLATVVSSAPQKVLVDWPGVDVVESFAAALADPTIDLVVIATPDHLHAEHAIAAIKAGKHVVIDKPLAPTLAEAQSIATHAASSDRLVSVFQNRRWDGDFLTLQRLLKEGSLGEIVEFTSHFDRFRPDVTHRWKDERAGGVWQDLGAHLVDQALRLFGMPRAVYADITTQKRGGAGADYAHVLLHYDRLRVSLHMSQLNAAHDFRFALHGTCGSYVKHGLDPQEDQSKAGLSPRQDDWGVDRRLGSVTQLSPDGTSLELPVPNEVGDYGAFYEQLRDAILGKGANPVPISQALDVIRVIEAGQLSAREAREVCMNDEPFL
jgi:predicted dehydrogenase